MKCVRTIKPDIAIPIHNNGWTYFKENNKEIKKELEKYEEESKLTRFLPKGKKNLYYLNKFLNPPL